MTKPSVLLALSTCTLAFTACSSGPGGEPGAIEGPWISETEQHGDTTVVRTISGSVWGDTLHLVPDLEIGVMEGESELMFGRISGLDIDADGNIYVLDRQAAELRVFSPNGMHERTIGRPGMGPGELNRPSYFRATSDSRLIVREEMGFRFSVFGTDGSFLYSWPRGGAFGTGAPFYFNTAGNVINPTYMDRLVEYDLRGNVVDEFDNPDSRNAPPALTVEMGPARASYRIPFLPRLIWTYTRTGEFMAGFSSAYAIERTSEGGHVLRIERTADPVAVTSDEVADRKNNIVRSIRENAPPNWEWNGPDVPPIKPYFTSIQPGTGGTIWIFREGPSEEIRNPNWNPETENPEDLYVWRQPISVDVFDADGRFLGPVAIPDNVSWLSPRPVLNAEWVIASTTHRDGFPQVVRYRLEPR